MLDDTISLAVTDLKQYAYCPRVVFYERCLPHVRPRTYKMDAGKERHEHEASRSARRTLKRYDADEGERRFNVRLFSLQMALHGLLDEVITLLDGTAIPVDYKQASKISPNHRIQLTAYALLLEECESTKVERGLIYLIPVHKHIEVPITTQLRERTNSLLEEIRIMIETERMPAAVVQKSQCASCEFRRFCNDTKDMVS